VCAELELRLVAARIAVMAAVGAAAIWVQRPVERHSSDAIECGLAADLLISRGVGTPDRFGQRVSAAGSDDVGDLTGGGPTGTEIEEQRHFHGDFRESSACFAVCSSYRLRSGRTTSSRERSNPSSPVVEQIVEHAFAGNLGRPPRVAMQLL